MGFANIPILLVAKALNVSNAKYLIAGYNTMSDLDRQKIDVKRLVSSTKTFLYLLATVPFLAFVARTFPRPLPKREARAHVRHRRSKRTRFGGRFEHDKG